MERTGRIDAASVFQADNNRVAEFLSAAANALDENASNSRDIQELKVDLTNALALAHLNSDKSLLTSLDLGGSEFLTRLKLRYGVEGLCRNVWRYTVQAKLNSLRQSICTWGEDLITAGKLVFNREFAVYRDGRCVREVSFANLYLDLADIYRDTICLLDQAGLQLLTLQGHDLADSSDSDQAIDTSFATSLGFKKVTYTVLANQKELICKRTIACAIRNLADASYATAELLAQNQIKNFTAPTLSTCEMIRTEGSLIDEMKLQYSNWIEGWENQRRTLILSLSHIEAAIGRLTQDFRDFASAGSNHQVKPPTMLSGKVQRQIATNLIGQGIKPSESESVVQKLAQYCERNQISADQIIEGELEKIHRSLDARAHATLRKKDTFVTIGAEEKAENLRKLTALESFFREQLVHLSALAFIVLLALPGCGLKGDPKSNVEDFRPAVPYVDAPAPPPMLKETSASKKKPEVPKTKK